MLDRGLLVLGVALLLAALVGTIIVGSSISPTTAPSVATDTNLSARVPPGQVGTSIRLDAPASVGGEIRTGDVIDLYTFNPEQIFGGPPTTIRLLTNQLVYAVARDGLAQTVTLSVAPDEALIVQQALQSGARPYTVIHAAGTGPTPVAAAPPTVFRDADLGAWLARVASAR